MSQQLSVTGFSTSQYGKVAESFKGGYVASGQSLKPRRINVGELSWEARCRYYDGIDQRHPLAKACIRTIAGQVMAQGLFLTPVTDDAGKPYPRTTDAKDACDELNERVGLDTMLYESAVTLAKYGAVFWEKSLDPFDVRIIPMQELIEPASTDGRGNVTTWRQRINWSGESPIWDATEIVHVGWDVTTQTWPYGTSLLVGLETEFEILEQLEIDIKEFMHRTAFPREMYQVGDGQFVPSGDDMEVIKARIKDWEPGEYIVTSYPIEHKSGGTGDSEVRNLNDVLTFLKCQLVDGLMTPPVSFQYSSTYASSKEMMVQQRANLVVPMQRLFKRKLETEVYKPFLESRGFSVKDTPTLHFESAEAHRVDMADYYLKLTSANIMPPRFAAQELGIPEEMYDAWQQEKQRQQEKMFTQKTEQLQQQAQQNKPFQKKEDTQA
jgi:hypothetical protein